MTQSGTYAMVKYVSFIWRSNTSIPETPVVANNQKDAGGFFGIFSCSVLLLNISLKHAAYML